MRRITTFLNIRSGEERLAGLLIFLYFSLAFGVVFVQSMAFGVFIAEYGVQGLPYSYISIAFLASLVALLYIRISSRVTFTRLLFINLSFLVGGSLLLWLALNTPLYHLAAFLLPLWFQISINLVNLAVWSLAGTLLNFQQGKRLFPLLGAGNWLANIVGGLFIPALVASVGAANLLFLAALCFGSSVYVLRTITRSYLHVAPVAPRVGGAARPSQTPQGIFRDRYVLYILAYIALWWVAFYFVDNIFYDRAFAQFPDANQLTAFIGSLLSVMGIVALIASVAINSRVIARFGLKVGLLAMPVLVTVCLAVLAFGGSLGAPLLLVFALGTFAKLTNVALGFSLSQSANAIVYQSLSETIRKRVQATAEGVVQPVAIGVAGLTLLALTAGLKFNYIGLAYTFIALGSAWLIVILLLSGNYVNALTQAITKRRLGESPTILPDPDSVALLRARLHDPHPGVAVYALTQLEVLDPQAVSGELGNLIQHPAAEVRRQAFLRIEDLKDKSLLNQVRGQLAVETDPSVQEAALSALAAITDGEPSPQLTAALNQTDAAVLRGALVGWLKYADDATARQKLDSLISSASIAERNLAIEILGQVNRPEFLPHLLTACNSPETARAAELALESIGVPALLAIQTAFSAQDAPRLRLMTLSHVLGRVGGKQAQTILLSRLFSPDSELRSHIFTALCRSDYHAPDASDIFRAVRTEATQAAWVSSVQVDLPKNDDTALLSAALQQFITETRERVLLLLAFIGDAKSITSARETLLSGAVEKHGYALEIIDTQLPAEWKPWVVPVVEDIAPNERLMRLRALAPQAHQTADERLGALIGGGIDHSMTNWTRACAIYTATRLDARACEPAITAASADSDALVSTTARWALARYSAGAPKGKDAMFSTIEKVIILKTVDLFSRMPDNVLAEVADLLEQVDVNPDETIFKQGDAGDSLYVIVDGSVRVHDDQRVLNQMGERSVFGELALLTGEPRSASVTAAEPTRLLRLERALFYQLVSERPEVATGVIQVLVNYVQRFVNENARLQSRNSELERRLQSP